MSDTRLRAVEAEVIEMRRIIDELKKRIATLEQERSAPRGRFGPGGPDRSDPRAERADLERRTLPPPRPRGFQGFSPPSPPSFRPH